MTNKSTHSRNWDHPFALGSVGATAIATLMALAQEPDWLIAELSGIEEADLEVVDVVINNFGPAAD